MRMVLIWVHLMGCACGAFEGVPGGNLRPVRIEAPLRFFYQNNFAWDTISQMTTNTPYAPLEAPIRGIRRLPYVGAVAGLVAAITAIAVTSQGDSFLAGCVFILCLAALPVVVAKRAYNSGLTRWLTVTLVVPGGNLLVILWLAFVPPKA